MCASDYLYDCTLFPGRFCPMFSEFVLAAGITLTYFLATEQVGLLCNDPQMTPISAVISIVLDICGHVELLTGLNLITAFY